MDKQMTDKINEHEQMNSEMNKHINGEINKYGRVNGEINKQINDEIEGHVNSKINKRMNRMRKAVILLIMTAAIAVHGVRVRQVNQNLDISKIQIYEKGEKVPFEKDFVENSAYGCEGYSIQVLDKQVYSSEEFLGKYDVEAAKGRHYDFYYTVDVKIYNDNTVADEMHGISLWNMYLKSMNDFIIPETEMTVQINSLPGISFALRPESDIDITIVYTMSDIDYKNIDEVKNTKYQLMITEYPVTKLLEI